MLKFGLLLTSAFVNMSSALREYVCLLMQGANSERLLMRRSASARAGPRPRHDAEFVLDERELAVRQEKM